MNYFPFSIFVGHFCRPGSRIRIRILNADPDPATQINVDPDPNPVTNSYNYADPDTIYLQWYRTLPNLPSKVFIN
jgi:hypothetical protein